MMRSGSKEVGMFLHVRKSFMIFKIVLACIAFLAAIIALLGTSQNSLLLTQETGKQLGVVMALVFGIITIVEAFMAPPEAIISDKILSGWKTAPDAHSSVLGMHKSGEEAAAR
jgi:peptidoglycan biosynthesis protein MviN/MurJ (putative lipid II flippase)